MSLNLIVTLIIVSVFLIVITTYFLTKGKLSERYSLLWYAFALIILIVSLFPQLFVFISSKLGFQVMSNLVVGLFIGILILLDMALCIMISSQKKKSILLIQEISLLKQRIENLELKDGKL